MKLAELLSVTRGFIEVYEGQLTKTDRPRKINNFPMASGEFENRVMEQKNHEFRDVYMITPYTNVRLKIQYMVIFIEGSDKLDDDEDYADDFHEAFDAFAKIRQ